MTEVLPRHREAARAWVAKWDPDGDRWQDDAMEGYAQAVADTEAKIAGGLDDESAALDSSAEFRAALGMAEIADWVRSGEYLSNAGEASNE